jgi:hypothetical protein
LAENLEWATRDWRDKENGATHPELTVDDLHEVCRRNGRSPVLWLEELDKIQPTDRRRNLIDSLVDAIYELDGMVKYQPS